MNPIGRVEAIGNEAIDDYWKGAESCIVRADRFDAEALQGLEEFSRDEVRQPSWSHELMTEYWKHTD